MTATLTAAGYRVTAAAVTATVNGFNGPTVRTFYRSAILPPEVSPQQIEHLLAVKLISPVEVGEPSVTVAGQQVTEPPVQQPVSTGDATDATVLGDTGARADQGDTTPPDGAGAEPDGDDSGSTEQDSDVEAKRAEARSKLPADGSLPDGRAGQPVWVEHLVGKGYGYEALVKEDKAELVKIAKGLVNA